MADTISQAITAGLKATLQSYGADKGVPVQSVRTWHETDLQIIPSQCPSIGVIDRGWTKAGPPSNGGLNPDGTVRSGIQQRTYTFDVPVHMVGPMNDPDALMRTMKGWLDGIAACVDDHHTLGGMPGYGEAEAGDPTEPFELESQAFTAGQVTVVFHTWSADGSIDP